LPRFFLWIVISRGIIEALVLGGFEEGNNHLCKFKLF
jgi:hypothetical protein